MPYVHGKSIIKIALADDSLLIQDLLPAHLDTIENCKVVIQAYNGRELLEKLGQKPNTNLVIMDIQMPEMDGIEAAKRVKAEFPEMKVLFVSVYSNELTWCRVMNTGADGFISKSSPVAEFKRAIYELMKNNYYFHDGFSGNSIRHVNGNGKKNKIAVSDEELLFLKQACTEKTYEAIARDMKTNSRHIDYIRQEIFEKFEVHNRVEMALFAFKGGIVT
jgi:two-component system, NarL family, invasion response regulator UvrY